MPWGKNYLVIILFCFVICGMYACSGDEDNAAQKSEDGKAVELGRESEKPSAADQGQQISQDASVAKEKVPEIAKPANGQWADPAVFEKAFMAENDWYLQLSTLGKVRIDSGKVLVCDPAKLHVAKPYVQSFPTGSFPVQIATDFTRSYPINYFARVVFNENPVVKWEFARLPGQQPVDIRDSSFYGFGVTSGMSTIMTPTTRAAFEGENPEAHWKHVFVDLMEENGYQGLVYQFDGHSLASVSSGAGKGTYATYVGRDADGKICRLLIDFGIIKWWVQNPS